SELGTRNSDRLVAPGEEDPAELRFRTQTSVLTDDNLRWTARARFGTYKFFGFVATDGEGFARLTPAGERFVASSRPGEVLLRQLLKWQYPDNQHRGSRWPAEDFAIYPFVATARLIRELGGLTRREIGLFCFTMRRTEDAAATAEAIRQFRARQAQSVGRAGKARSTRGTLAAAQARYQAEGRRVVLGSTDDYADALIRSFRYTGLFSVRGARIVVASGREAELDELVYGDVRSHPLPKGKGCPTYPPTPSPQGKGSPASAEPAADRSPFPAREGGQGVRSLQLALGEAPPVRLAAPRPLFADYANADVFYRYYGDADQPRLPWEDPARLAEIARQLDAQVAELRAREAMLRAGRSILAGPTLGPRLPDAYDALLEVVEGLRRTKFRLESALYATEQRSPQRLVEALDFYRSILAREVIDPPTFLEWNTWRVFLALDRARQVVPHLALDDDLQPLNTAQGNQPDLEVDYGDFLLVVEVTLRTGTDQRQAEARPVTRHILEAQRRYGDRSGAAGWPVYGLFIAPKLHPDTATDFFVALKYRVIERQQIAAIPLTLRQFTAALRPFGGALAFAPEHLRRLVEGWVEAGLAAETGEDWLAGIDAALRRWLVALGAPLPISEAGAVPVPLPLFGAARTKGPVAGSQ
ncbi:MAG: AlwI family type II restriction endonuclease, partial [Chloroflexota bacterium]